MPSPALSFSHLGIFVTDIERLTLFYTRVLGMVVTDRGTLPSGELVFLSREPHEHHQLVLCSGRAAGSATTVNQISFRTGALDDLRRLRAMLAGAGAHDIQPIDHGVSWSVYARDPEDNRLEFFVDTPWYITQPLRTALDLDRSDAQIHAASQAACQSAPGFMPMPDWRTAVARRIADAQTP